MPYTRASSSSIASIDWLRGPTAGDVRILLIQQVSEDTITTARRGFITRVTTAGVTPTTVTEERTSTRSPAYGGRVATAFVTAPTNATNPLLVVPGIPSMLRTIWRPPRPWAAIVLTDLDQIANSGNLSIIRDGLTVWDYRGGTEQVLDARRRTRRAGLWHYANHSTGRSGQSTRQRSESVQWVAYVSRARRVEYQNLRALRSAVASTTYNDSPSGGIVLGGATAVAETEDNAPAGGIVLGGSAASSKVYDNSPAGGIVLGGSAASAKSYADAPSSGIVLGGSVAVTEAEANAPTGGIRLGGTSWGDQVLLDDDFGRVVANDWGGQWTKIASPSSDGPASDLSVDGARGIVQSPTHKREWIQARDVWLRDLSITGVVDLSLIPAGSAVAVAALMRWTDASNYYRPRIIFSTTGVVQTAVSKTVAGVATVVSALTTALTGYTASTLVRFRISIVGTRIRVTTWYDGNAEPAPQVDVTDGSLTLDGGLVLELDLTGLTNNPAVHVDEIRARTIPSSIDYASAIAPAGIVLGGSASSSKSYADAPASGIVLGGSCSSSLTVGGTTYSSSPVGGIVLGGLASSTKDYSAAPSGGIVLGGSATAPKVYTGTSTGGVSLGGTASSSLAWSTSVAGGILLGGAAVPLSALRLTASDFRTRYVLQISDRRSRYAVSISDRRTRYLLAMSDRSGP